MPSCRRCSKHPHLRGPNGGPPSSGASLRTALGDTEDVPEQFLPLGMPVGPPHGGYAQRNAKMHPLLGHEHAEKSNNFPLPHQTPVDGRKNALTPTKKRPTRHPVPPTLVFGPAARSGERKTKKSRKQDLFEGTSKISWDHSYQSLPSVSSCPFDLQGPGFFVASGSHRWRLPSPPRKTGNSSGAETENT